MSNNRKNSTTTKKDNGKSSNGDDEALCGKCEKKCENLSLTCDMCGLWHHTKCVGMSDQAYRLIGEGEIIGLKWYCKRCDQFAANIMVNIKKLTTKLNALEEKTEGRVARVEDRLAKVEERENLVARVEDRLAKVEEREKVIDGTIERIQSEPIREVTDDDIKNQISMATSSFLKEKKKIRKQEK